MTDLALSRELYVPKELVYEVLTEAAHLGAWYAPADATDVAVDARPGGGFRVVWPDAAGDTLSERAEFLELSPDRLRYRLVPAAAPAGEPVTVTVTLSAREGGSAARIGLTATGHGSNRARDAHRAWLEAWLDRLESYFAVI